MSKPPDWFGTIYAEHVIEPQRREHARRFFACDHTQLGDRKWEYHVGDAGDVAGSPANPDVLAVAL